MKSRSNINFLILTYNSAQHNFVFQPSLHKHKELSIILSSRLPYTDTKIIIRYKMLQCYTCSAWVLKSVSRIQRRTQVEGVIEQRAGKFLSFNVSTSVGMGERRVHK